MKNAKISIETSVYSGHSAQKTFEEISSIGYRFVEIAPWHFLNYQTQTAQLKELLRENSLEPSSLLVTWIFLGTLDGGREKNVNEMKKYAELADAIGCDTITCASGMRGKPAQKDAHTRAFAKSVNELLPTLRKHDMRIIFECHPGDFFENAIEAIDMLRSFNEQRIGYLYCIPHSFLFDVGDVNTIEYGRNLLGHVHVADTNRPREHEHQHLIPGLGEVDFKRIFRDLRSIGYGGFYSAAPFTHRDNPKEAALQTKKKIEEFLSDQR